MENVSPVRQIGHRCTPGSAMAEFDHGDEIPSLDPVAHRTGAPNEDGEIAPLPRDSERAQQRQPRERGRPARSAPQP